MCSFRQCMCVILLAGMMGVAAAADFIPEETEGPFAMEVAAGPSLPILLLDNAEPGHMSPTPYAPVSVHSLRSIVRHLSSRRTPDAAVRCFSPELECLGWLFPCLRGQQHLMWSAF